MPNYTNNNSFFNNKVVTVSSINTTFSVGSVSNTLFRAITIPVKYNKNNPEDVALVKASFFTPNKSYKNKGGGLISYTIISDITQIESFIQKDNQLYDRVLQLFSRSTSRNPLIVQIALLDICNLDSSLELTDVDILNDIYNKNINSRSYNAFNLAKVSLKEIGYITLDIANLYTKKRLDETNITIDSGVYIFGCDYYKEGVLSQDYTGLLLNSSKIIYKYKNKVNPDFVTNKEVSTSIFTKVSLLAGLPDSALKTWLTDSDNTLFFYLNLSDMDVSTQKLEITKVEGANLTALNYIGSNVKGLLPADTEWKALNTLLNSGFNNIFIYEGFSSISLFNNFIKKEFIRSSIIKDYSVSINEVLWVLDTRWLFEEGDSNVNSLIRKALWSFYSNTPVKLTLGAYKDLDKTIVPYFTSDDASLVFFMSFGDLIQTQMCGCSYTQYNSTIPELLVATNVKIADQLGINFSQLEKSLFIQDAQGVLGFLEEALVQGLTVFRLFESKTCFLTNGSPNPINFCYMKAFINYTIESELDSFISKVGANSVRTISAQFLTLLNTYLVNNIANAINIALDMEANTSENQFIPIETTNPQSYVTKESTTTSLGSQDVRYTFNLNDIYKVQFLKEADYYKFSYTTLIPE
jgi:hypothetical protein